jgi:salicylate hydroxylase
MGMQDARILLVGAGIGGLSAALALQHFGHKVLLFEQAMQLKEIGAGVIITPNAMHALNFLGVGRRVAEEAGETTPYAIHDYRSGRILQIGSPASTYFEKYGATLHQAHRADLHTALADAVRANDPNCIQLGHGFVGLEQDAQAITAYFTNGGSYRGDLLIGCDGNASRVRAAVFGDEQVNYTGQVAFRALADMKSLPRSMQEHRYGLHIGPKRLLLHYPLRRDTIMNIIGIAREPRWQDEGWTIPASIEEFAALYEDFHADVLQLIHAIPAAQLFKWGLRDREPLQEYTQGRVVMLGDAAHPMTPFLGQGACIAIEDGMILGRAFAAANNIGQAFSTYERARKERANAVQLGSREQADQLQGITREGANPGRTAEDRGLFNYNPVTVAI